MSDKKIAKQVLDVIGGKENIENYTHCATRLRIVLKNNELVDKKATDDIPELKGYFYLTGQHQFVFGTGRVNDIYQAFESEIEEISQIIPMKVKIHRLLRNPLIGI